MQTGAECADQVEYGGAIADVDGVMNVALEGTFEAFLVPGSIAVRAEELAPLVVVQSVDGESTLVEGLTDFRTD